MIRDSDGTVLSDRKSPMQDMESILLSVLLEITMHGQRRIRISYSRHFWMTSPKGSTENTLYIGLMDDFFDEQFRVNDTRSSFQNTGRYMIEQLTVLFRRISGATTAQITA